MKIFKQYRTSLLLVFASFSVFSNSIFEADRLFESGRFEEAIEGYSAAALIGSPHAFYQLGTIYLKGLEVKQDPVSAYVWFSLAAEYSLSDASATAEELAMLFSKTQKQSAQELLKLMKYNIGKSAVQQKYFPIINQQNLAEKVTFGGSGQLEVFYNDPDLIIESFNVGTNTNFSGSKVNDLVLEGIEEGGNFFGLGSFGTPFGVTGGSFEERRLKALSQANAHQIVRRIPFLIVEYDVGPDGSIRNVRPVQEIGYSRPLLERFLSKTFPAPNFKDSRVSFVNRSYLGTASLDRFSMRKANKRLFFKIRRHARKLKQSQALEDRYQYAMTLSLFKQWIWQEENEAEQILKEVAQAGHPRAQFEYGAKLYREQRDITDAIHWISEASKYGLGKAEYLLGNILLSSPWVKRDEKKALFWFESALKKGNQAAKLKAAELKLLATDSSLRNIPSATEYLQQLEDTQSRNPEYYFLLAVSHKDKDNRDFKQAVRYIEKAIRLGQKFNWDVSYWQALVEKWTTGSVYIIE